MQPSDLYVVSRPTSDVTDSVPLLDSLLVEACLLKSPTYLYTARLSLQCDCLLPCAAVKDSTSLSTWSLVLSHSTIIKVITKNHPYSLIVHKSLWRATSTLAEVLLCSRLQEDGIECFNPIYNSSKSLNTYCEPPTQRKSQKWFHGPLWMTIPIESYREYLDKSLSLSFSFCF